MRSKKLEMKKIYKRQRILKYIIISFLLTTLILLPIKKYFQIEKDIQIIFDIKLKKDINLQIFYTEDISKAFNEVDSVKRKISITDSQILINLSNIKK